MDRLQRQWLSQATALTSANEDVYRQYRQAVEDMGALRLFDHDFAPDVWVPAAGVPWFVTIFGRDSLMVSLQNMLVHAGNAGHALWSGIASAEHAAQVVARLLQPDMWSGWGIRTLAASNSAYNPFAYQRGSVWPHDNGIIALGFKRHGFAAEAARVFRDISEAASYFVGYWPPELYAGIERRLGTFPVQYRGANVSHAWAAGSVFHLLQAILGLQADAPNHRLNIDPQLPSWLPEVTLRGLAVGHAGPPVLARGRSYTVGRFGAEG